MGLDYEGTVEVCAYRVTFRRQDNDLDSKVDTDELRHDLEEAAEERAQACTIDGCHSGQLIYETADRYITGWWEIDRP